jgi:hypothetical protein
MGHSHSPSVLAAIRLEVIVGVIQVHMGHSHSPSVLAANQLQVIMGAMVCAIGMSTQSQTLLLQRALYDDGGTVKQCGLTVKLRKSVLVEKKKREKDYKKEKDEHIVGQRCEGAWSRSLSLHLRCARQRFDRAGTT